MFEVSSVSVLEIDLVTDLLLMIKCTEETIHRKLHNCLNKFFIYCSQISYPKAFLELTNSYSLSPGLNLV